MIDLDTNASLRVIQNYVSEMERERGFVEQTVKEKCLLLGEEIGELFKAVRKTEGIRTDPESDVGEVSDELADVLIYLCAIANRYNINLEEAFRTKENKNNLRVWE